MSWFLKHSLARPASTTLLQRKDTPDKGRKKINLHAILDSSVSEIQDITLRHCNVF